MQQMAVQGCKKKNFPQSTQSQANQNVDTVRISLARYETAAY